MSQSLSPQCTPLKHEYDSCFNSWFKGYLEPAVTAYATSEQRVANSKQKSEEFEQNCGRIWAAYRDYVQNAVKEKGLDELLKQAREENPLNDPPPQSVTE